MSAVRRAWFVVAATALLVAVFLSFSRLVAPPWRVSVLAASFAPAALPIYLATVLVAGLGLWRAGHRSRRALVLGAALAGAALHTTWLAPAFLAEDTPSAAGPPVRVLTLNLRLGQADPADVGRLLREEEPDLVVLTEVTPEAYTTVAGQGAIRGTLPYRGGAPAPGSLGTVVLSSWPLTAEPDLGLGPAGHRLAVAAPAAFTLLAVHPAYPLRRVGPWHRDLAAIGRESDSIPAPVLAVGDFNATVDHGAFREVLGTGLSDAAEQAGSGWQPTWPAPGSRPLGPISSPGPVLRLDHVLVPSTYVGVATRTHVVSGTDHLALVADVVPTGR